MRPHDGRAIPTFLRQALQDRPITVFGDGSQTRSFCYVDDLIRGMIALAESGEHDPVNIGNPDEFTLLELAQAVIEVTGSRSEIVYEALPTDDPQVAPAGHRRRARQLLGWEPTVALREGLAAHDRAGRRRGARRSSTAVTHDARHRRVVAPLDVLACRSTPTTTGEADAAGRRRTGPRSTSPCRAQDIRRKRPPALASCCGWTRCGALARVLTLLALDFAGDLPGDLHRAAA